jgi:HKD family nuclease
MELRILKSSPLRPLARHARRLSEGCDELLVATAFVSDAALADVVGSALDHDAHVRFLTGTFGNVTRLRTFKRLWRFSQLGPLQARIWPGDFHAKLLLWRTGTSGNCWIGSSNLTDRGLENEGELVAAIAGRWQSPQFRKLRRAFAAEWARAYVLDEAFLRRYREASRVGKLLKGQRRTQPRTQAHKRRAPSRTAHRLIVLPVGMHYDDDSAAARRIGARLGGTADAWYRSGTPDLRHVRDGQHCLLADGVDNTLQLIRVTDTAKDGRGYVIAYEPFSRNSECKSTRSMKTKLIRLGLSPTKSSFRTKWLGHDTAARVVEAIYGPRMRLRFEREFKQRK